jgi:hypothetical protein
MNFDQRHHERQRVAGLARRAYRASELPRVLPWGKTKIAEMIRTGKIKSRMIGGSRIIAAEEVERLIEGGE